jgi:aspartate ammonia-lyase
MQMNRTEKDTLGSLEIPREALYGIHSRRAADNFPLRTPFPEEWYRAMGRVKASVYKTYSRFLDAATERYGSGNRMRSIPDEILPAMTTAAGEVAAGMYYDQFIVPGIQGGAGTSINMNINEIIANAALISLGHKPGDYHIIDPVEHCNIYQSTNDTVPTALTIASMDLLTLLGESINIMRQKLEKLETENRSELRLGYTQMQEALPSSFGILFSSYNDALSRDWWRVSKCLERIKAVNMGGGATGTGMAVPRYFIMEIVPELRSVTGLPLSRSENMADATSNMDRWVEIHATIKAHAVTLEKMVSDLRLLSSDLVSPNQIRLPEKQVGSSIMPGKINPVIPEYVVSAAHKVYSNDSVVTSLAGQGCLELNAYIPMIGVSVLESLKLLTAANLTITDNILKGLIINHNDSYERVMHSGSITTALIPYIGYNKASAVAKEMKLNSLSISEANDKMNFIDSTKLGEILQPGNLLKLGYSLEDL